MGTRKKMQRQFYFNFCRRKGQTQRHYNGKSFRATLHLKKCYVASLNILLSKCPSLQIFINLYLKTLSNFILCNKIEVRASLLLACRDEKIGYHLSKYLSKPSK